MNGDFEEYVSHTSNGRLSEMVMEVADELSGESADILYEAARRLASPWHI